jgi:hypothetical protein
VCLLLARACPSSDSVVLKAETGVIQQLVCKSRKQINLIDVQFAHGATHRHCDEAQTARVGFTSARSSIIRL